MLVLGSPKYCGVESLNPIDMCRGVLRNPGLACRYIWRVVVAFVGGALVFAFVPEEPRMNLGDVRVLVFFLLRYFGFVMTCAARQLNLRFNVYGDTFYFMITAGSASFFGCNTDTYLQCLLFIGIDSVFFFSKCFLLYTIPEKNKKILGGLAKPLQHFRFMNNWFKPLNPIVPGTDRRYPMADWRLLDLYKENGCMTLSFGVCSLIAVGVQFAESSDIRKFLFNEDINRVFFILMMFVSSAMQDFILKGVSKAVQADVLGIIRDKMYLACIYMNIPLCCMPASMNINVQICLERVARKEIESECPS